MKKTSFLALNKAVFEQITLPNDSVIVDLGCQDASFLIELQEAFPNKIKSAIGVDINDVGFKNIEYKAPIELKVMNCSKKLDFADNTFDLVFTKDMFECVPDKGFLVNEIYRVLKPGGVVICVNCDWDSIVYNGANKELIRKILHAYAITKQPWMEDIDSWIGRRMYGFFRKSNLFQNNMSVYNVVETEYKEGSYGYNFSIDIAWLYKENTGTITEKEYAGFIADLKLAQKEGTYIFSKPYYIYKGIKL